MGAGTYDAVVAELAVPHRRKAAERRLVSAGPAATPAVRRGLRHEDPAVRVGCCRVLDHFLDEAALPELLESLRDADDSVRAWALHALACDRCKEGSCRPGEGQSLPVAVDLLLHDPAEQVRCQAIGLVGAAVHRHPELVDVFERVRTCDPSPAVRKVAAWWVPGGPRYERTKPPPPRGRRLPAR